MCTGYGDMQAQRAGKEPTDSATYSSIWSWKEDAFLDVCPTLKKSMSASAKRALTDFPGYFEAGSAFPRNLRIVRDRRRRVSHLSECSDGPSPWPSPSRMNMESVVQPHPTICLMSLDLGLVQHQYAQSHDQLMMDFEYPVT